MKYQKEPRIMSGRRYAGMMYYTWFKQLWNAQGSLQAIRPRDGEDICKCKCRQRFLPAYYYIQMLSHINVSYLDTFCLPPYPHPHSLFA